MPQVDLVSACAGGVSSDSKISCETLAADDGDPLPSSSDLPPESFFLSKADEIDWIDRNAFIERKDSAKGGSLHPIHLIPNLPITSNQSFDSGSHKHPQSAKSKPSIIGLPKTQKATYAEATHRRRSGSIRLFPKRSHSSSSNSGRKSAVPLTEPSSPKVSCMGRVKSKRDRSRRKKQLEPSRSSKANKTGFWNGFRSIFKCHKPSKKEDEPAPVATVGKLTKGRSVRMPEVSAADPPNLGAVNRFSSGRRSDAWAADLEADDVKSQPLDRVLV